MSNLNILFSPKQRPIAVTNNDADMRAIVEVMSKQTVPRIVRRLIEDNDTSDLNDIETIKAKNTCGLFHYVSLVGAKRFVLILTVNGTPYLKQSDRDFKGREIMMDLMHMQKFHKLISIDGLNTITDDVAKLTDKLNDPNKTIAAESFLDEGTLNPVELMIVDSERTIERYTK